MNAANRITVARIGLIPLLVLFLQPFPDGLVREYAVFEWLEQYGMYAATFVFVLAAATDKLDGYVARTYNQTTNLGKLLDPLADKLLLLTALMMLVQLGLIPSWIAVVIIGRESVITGIRAAAAARGVVLAADTYGKWKMVVQVAAISIVLVQQLPFAAFAGSSAGSFAMLAAAAITVYSGIRYIAQHGSLLLRPNV